MEEEAAKQRLKRQVGHSSNVLRKENERHRSHFILSLCQGLVSNTNRYINHLISQSFLYRLDAIVARLSICI